MQYRIFEKGKLLNQEGHLYERGYAKQPLRDFVREDVKSKWLLRESEHYLVMGSEGALEVGILSTALYTMVRMSVFDFKNACHFTKTQFFARATKLPDAPNQAVVFSRRKTAFSISEQAITAKCKGFVCDIKLQDRPQESVALVTAFKNPSKFCYQNKVVRIQASGSAYFGASTINFGEESFCHYSYLRGAYLPKRQIWAACSGFAEGKPFGLNLGCSFKNNSDATLDSCVFEGKCNKLDSAKFCIPKTATLHKKYIMGKWSITTSDNRCELYFRPIMVRKHFGGKLVLGKLEGTVFLDDGGGVVVAPCFAFVSMDKRQW